MKNEKQLTEIKSILNDINNFKKLEDIQKVLDENNEIMKSKNDFVNKLTDILNELEDGTPMGSALSALIFIIQDEGIDSLNEVFKKNYPEYYFDSNDVAD